MKTIDETTFAIFIAIATLMIGFFITISLILFVGYYKSKQKVKSLMNEIEDYAEAGLNKAKSRAKRLNGKRIVKGLLLKSKVELALGENFGYTYDDDFFNENDDVNVDYFDGYKEMKVLMFKRDVGFVLVSDDMKEPKFYFDFKVHPGIPGTTFVEGYLETVNEESIFFITRIHTPSKEQLSMHEEARKDASGAAYPLQPPSYSDHIDEE